MTESGGRWTRRRFLIAGSTVAIGVLLVRRLGFYPDRPWAGTVLSEWEAHTLAACVGALIPEVAGDQVEHGPTPMEVAEHVDHFLNGVPASTLLEIRGMFFLIEHGTVLGGRLSRFTRQDAKTQRELLLGLKNWGGLLGQAFEGIRSFVVLGWYQDPRSWEAIGYTGPLLTRPARSQLLRREDAGIYGRLVATPSDRPKGT